MNFGRSFNSALKKVLEHEGGYVNHPKDPGGETNYGITKRVAVEHGYTGDMRDIPMDIVKHIYYVSYWLKVRADQFPPVIAFNLFDAAVNHGVSRSIQFIQRAVGVKDDGIMGPVTIGAIKRSNEVNTMLRFQAERLFFYTNLKTFDHFGRGWMRRMADNIRGSVYE